MDTLTLAKALPQRHVLILGARLPNWDEEPHRVNDGFAIVVVVGEVQPSTFAHVCVSPLNPDNLPIRRHLVVCPRIQDFCEWVHNRRKCRCVEHRALVKPNGVFGCDPSLHGVYEMQALTGFSDRGYEDTGIFVVRFGRTRHKDTTAVSHR